jgi:hypothetical protein
VIDRTPPEHAGLRGPGGQARGVLAVVGGRQDDQLGPGGVGCAVPSSSVLRALLRSVLSILL